MCPHCRAFITNRDRTCPYCNEKVGARAIDKRDDSPIGGFIPQNRFVTALILLINLGFYVATVLASMKAGNGDAVMSLDNDTLIAFGAKVPLRFLTHYSDVQGQYWRLVTAGFLHGGLIHILMNSWVLWDVGAQVDEIYGTTRMLVIYFASSVCGFALSTLMGGGISIGASAGICGLIGAMIALGLRHHNPIGDAMRGSYIRWVVMILIIGFLPMFHIDNAAHIGGLIGGFGVAYAAGEPGRINSAMETLWKAAAGMCVLITVCCFLLMYLSTRPNMPQ
jgi:rhomboid protease GluP